MSNVFLLCQLSITIFKRIEMHHFTLYSHYGFPLIRIIKLLDSLGTITVLVKIFSIAGADKFFFYNFSCTVITCFCFISIEIEYKNRYSPMVSYKIWFRIIFIIMWYMLLPFVVFFAKWLFCFFTDEKDFAIQFLWTQRTHKTV